MWHQLGHMRKPIAETVESVEEYVRDEFDRFYTQEKVARVFAREAVDLFGSATLGCFIEPSCGDGALIRAFGEQFEGLYPKTCKVERCITFDIVTDPKFDAGKMFEAKVSSFRGDWLERYQAFAGKADLILANPPFAKSVPGKKPGSIKREAIIQQHVEAMHAALAEGGLCGVLSAQRFLAQPRTEWLKNAARPFKIQQLSPRPSFTEDGKTDMSEYVLTWWEKVNGSVHAPETKFEWLEWKEETP